MGSPDLPISENRPVRRVTRKTLIPNKWNLDWGGLERRRMAKVVLIQDMAEYYGKDRSHFMRFLKKKGFELLFVTDSVSGQRMRCITAEDAERVKELMKPEHEVVSFS